MKSTETSHNHFLIIRNKIAFLTNEESWTYERLASEVNRLAGGLVERGVRPGDRVALHMANLPEFVIAYQACFKVGAIAAPLNIRFRTAELDPLLQRLRPALYVGQAALYSQIASIDSSILPANGRFVVDGPVNDPRAQPWIDLLADAKRKPVQRTPDIDAPAVLLTTSGTTGQPKFVIHTLATLAKITESFKQWDLDSDQIATLACPMVHGSGFFTMLACIRSGVPFVLLDRFDPDAVLNAIERQRPASCSWRVMIRKAQSLTKFVLTLLSG
jgi:long-chain acyl-CoA synthetase